MNLGLTILEEQLLQDLHLRVKLIIELDWHLLLKRELVKMEMAEVMETTKRRIKEIGMVLMTKELRMIMEMQSQLAKVFTLWLKFYLQEVLRVL